MSKRLDTWTCEMPMPGVGVVDWDFQSKVCDVNSDSEPRYYRISKDGRVWRKRFRRDIDTLDAVCLGEVEISIDGAMQLCGYAPHASILTLSYFTLTFTKGHLDSVVASQPDGSDDEFDHGNYDTWA